MHAFSIRDFEAEARRRLSPAVYDLFAGGGGDGFDGDMGGDFHDYKGRRSRKRGLRLRHPSRPRGVERNRLDAAV